MRPSILLVATILVASACSADSNSSPLTTPPSGSTSSSGLNIAVDSGFADRTAVVAATIPAIVHITLAGQPAAGITVTWIVTTGHGTISAASSTTDATGAATTNWTLGDTVGVNNLEAAITGASATMQATSTAAAPAALFAASPDSDAVVAGASTLITVRAADRFGNAVAGVVISWAATGGALTLTSTTTGANGRAEVVFSSEAGPRSYIVTATAPDLAPINFKILGL